MGRLAGWMQELTGRGAMRSPGAPSHRRVIRLWRLNRCGLLFVSHNSLSFILLD
jgi:hypothetical protein